MTHNFDLLKVAPNFRALGSVDCNAVDNSELQLSVIFANEYRDYLIEFGVVSVNGHELTGICKSERLHVVDVTTVEKGKNPTVDKSWYVVERTNIDGIVVWQTPNGEIFQTSPTTHPIKIADSLVDYLLN